MYDLVQHYYYLQLGSLHFFTLVHAAFYDQYYMQASTQARHRDEKGWDQSHRLDLLHFGSFEH